MSKDHEVQTGGGVWTGIPEEAIGKLIGVQAEGAIPNGARVVKVLSDEGDMHAPGCMATVLGSHKITIPDTNMTLIGYFVTWDDTRGALAFVIDRKIREVDSDGGEATSPDENVH